MEKYYITVSLPRSIDGVTVLRNGSPVYETNYFCDVYRDKKTGVFFVEWDVNFNYCKFFNTREAAKKMAESITLEGTKVENYYQPSGVAKLIFDKPLNIKK